MRFLKHNKISFGTKIFYVFTIFIVLTYISFSSFFIYYQSKTLKKNLINEGKLLIDLLSYSSRLGVFAENANLLKDPIEGIMHNKEVMLVQVFTDNGRQLKKQERTGKETNEKSSKKYFTRHDKIMNMIKKSKSTYYSEDNDTFEFWAPVISKRTKSEEEGLFFEENVSQTDDTIIGFVRIIFTTELLNKNLKGMLLKSIFIPITFMVPGWFILYFIVKGITSPLNRLSDGVTAVGTGSSVERVSVETKDEIGKLAQAFNDMVESLKTKDVEKQQIEEQLRQAQKMEAIGTFAGGIAHDFNNILNVIIGYGNLLLKQMNSQDSERDYLDNLLSTAKRASYLTKSLLTLSRQQEINLEPVNINDIIRNLEKILVSLMSKDIEISTNLSEEDLVVMADTGQIEHVLINLVTNARDAMPHGGTFTISTECVNKDKQFIIFSGHGDPGQYAVISVTDTGIGMNDQIKEKIFDPFFTTKEQGKGTGLGLSMVYGIIKQHNGYINVSSKPGQGTIFKIYLQLSKLR